MPERKVKFQDAGALIREFEEEHKDQIGNAWPTRCATAQILLKRDDGTVIETDMHFSANVDENGQFDNSTNNPLVIHNAPGGVPQHEYCIVQVRDRRGQPRAFVHKYFAAYASKFMDQRIPATEEKAAVATPGLGSPDLPT